MDFINVSVNCSIVFSETGSYFRYRSTSCSLHLWRGRRFWIIYFNQLRFLNVPFSIEGMVCAWVKRALQRQNSVSLYSSFVFIGMKLFYLNHRICIPRTCNTAFFRNNKGKVLDPHNLDRKNIYRPFTGKRKPRCHNHGKFLSKCAARQKTSRKSIYVKI